MASSFVLPCYLLRLFRARVISVMICSLIGIHAAMVQSETAKTAPIATTAIKVDQVGYPVDGPKVALISDSAGGPVAAGRAAQSFELRQTSNNAVVWKGKPSAPVSDPDTGDQVQTADFSGFRQAGTYYVDVPGVGRSWDFTLGRNVFERAYYMAMRGFYGQRCGTAVDMGPEFPGYSHPACHLHGEFHASSGTSGPRDNPGGWHDAGDYGRYMVNSGISTGTLLWAWEIYGRNLKSVNLKIPESGNGTPDILNEVRWNLEWMLKMQDSDGGVWHKQTSEHFDGFEQPQDDHLPSEVIGTGTAPFKSTCATADLASVGAIAARVYKPYDAKFAARALDAARQAFSWTEKNPNVTFRNPRGISTGEYGDSNCSDERLWAAAELYRTTGEKAYSDYFLANYAAFLSKLDSPPAESWSQVAPMGLWTYALARQAGTDKGAVEAIRQRTIAAAETVVTRTRAAGYINSMKTSDYVWGSNGVAAGYGMYLLIADQFEPNREFVDTARDNLHYILGRNTFSLSWVTQLGENPFMHPHHRPSASSHMPAPWPGLMSGGPNRGRNDAVLVALPRDTPPARVYADQTGSYASNEICINWQAALVFLLAGELK
jgi:endoglucanase